MPKQSQTLFDKYGGVPTVSALVGAFYTRVLAAERLAGYFKNTDIPALVNHQIAFMRYVMENPTENFTTERMAAAHQPLVITKADYAEVVEILTEVLAEGGVTEEDLLTIVKRISFFADAIVHQSE